MCGFMSVLCRYFCLCYVQFVLLVLCAVFMLVDCAVCSTLLAPLVAGASRPQGPLRGPRNCTSTPLGGCDPPTYSAGVIMGHHTLLRMYYRGVRCQSV